MEGGGPGSALVLFCCPPLLCTEGLLSINKGKWEGSKEDVHFANQVCTVAGWKTSVSQLPGSAQGRVLPAPGHSESALHVF